MEFRIFVILMILTYSNSQIIINLTRKSLTYNHHPNSNQTRNLTWLLEQNGKFDRILSSRVQYYGTFEVGSDKQEITFAFDTNSNSIWFPSKDCLHCREFENRFNYQSSNTYRSQDDKAQIIEVNNILFR